MALVGATPRTGRRIRRRLLALQVAIVLVTVLAVAAVVLFVQDRYTRELAFEEVDTVATAIAANPEVIDDVNDPDAAASIQPIAHLAERSAGVSFVVVVNREGLRVAHPDPELIGQPVSSDHGPILSGESFRGVEEGPVGVTLRSKVPIWDGDTVVGSVSVGILQSEIRADLLEVVLGFAPWILGAAALGTAVAAWASRYVRRRIYGAEPEEMAGLHQSRQALLHSVGDGVVGVDEHGTITLANDEARRLLGVSADVEGQLAAEVLDEDVAAMLLSPAAGPEATGFVLAGERILLAKARPVLVGGRPVGRTLTLQDRTELESTFRELEGQRSMTEALRSQTHEFSNRLHVISGLLSLGEAAEAEEYVRSLTGPLGSSGTPDLGDASLTALVGAKAAVAREAGVELTVAGDSAVAPDWRADDDTLTVVANLLTNAIEAAGDGGRVLLRVRAGGAGAEAGGDDGRDADQGGVEDAGRPGVAVTVEDSGPGLDPAAADRLFRWGESTKQRQGTAAPVGGRGVGLALVDRIVRRRRGRVDVGPSPLGGARFHAAWPGENDHEMPAGGGAGSPTGSAAGSEAIPEDHGATPAGREHQADPETRTDQERRLG
ncbi:MULTISPECIES: ATP-binding protein [Micrococcaceae]|uniref:sensor histidine kinase n=2 Tax=Micrococcales TaxID=85006 RepID=UPI001607B168|nr:MULTISPECIES: ATP-binding protein [Micrococcaceae]MBB5750133.1 two-component system CitB family sensor kinase [Micrococcus sp. TA1]HRO31640.1 ATP-binding protein [Citricoccus sp.]